jgi:hypothetical protein
MTRFLLTCLAVLAGLIGCGGRGSDTHQPPAIGQTTAAISPTSSSSASATSGTCPRTGLWAICSVEKRLSQSGFVVNRGEREGPPRQGFRVRPALYTLGRSRLEVFLYPTEAAANADVANLDTLIAAPRGARNPWEMMPTFVRSVNLIAVYLTENPTQAERLTLALTAGAPQP